MWARKGASVASLTVQIVAHCIVLVQDVQQLDVANIVIYSYVKNARESIHVTAVDIQHALSVLYSIYSMAMKIVNVLIALVCTRHTTSEFLHFL